MDKWHLELPKHEGPENHPANSWYRLASADGSTVAYVIGKWEAEEMVKHHNEAQKA